jgi:hypothetical protein
MKFPYFSALQSGSAIGWRFQNFKPIETFAYANQVKEAQSQSRIVMDHLSNVMSESLSTILKTASSETVSQDGNQDSYAILGARQIDKDQEAVATSNSLVLRSPNLKLLGALLSQAYKDPQPNFFKDWCINFGYGLLGIKISNKFLRDTRGDIVTHANDIAELDL